MSRYFYRISYSWYDEGGYCVLWSDAEYSKEDFDRIVEEAVREAVDRLLSADEVDEQWIGSSSIYGFTIEIMESKGFHQLEFDGDYTISGRTIFDGEGWGEEWLNKTLDRETIDRIVTFNKDMDRHLMKK